MSDTCCGSAVQVFTLSGDAESPVQLHRCGTCGARAYHRGGVPLPAEAAFAALATTFHKDTFHKDTFHKDGGVARQPRPASRAPRAPRSARPEQPLVDVTGRSELTELLSGWSVLGAR